MTKEQIIRLVGRDNVTQDEGDTLHVKTPPRPYSGFEEYVLIVSFENVS